MTKQPTNRAGPSGNSLSASTSAKPRILLPYPFPCPMKIVCRYLLPLLVISLSVFAQAPAPSVPPAAAGAPAAPAAAGARRGQRTPSNPKNDALYKLGPDSKPMDGVPKGKFSEAKHIESQVFPGTQHTYYVYVPAQYDPSKPAALMVFNDGQAMMKEPGSVMGHNVLDNLIYRREIPVMIGVFINPGRRPDQPEPPEPGGGWGDATTNRPTEYNTPDDKYARVMVEELMPALKKEYNLSPDPELHGIMGASSGGIAAFSTAWFRPNDFRKVITIVGSFVDLRGGYVFPEFVAESEKKPIRIFMQDGRNDNRNLTDPKRDWFFQNVRLMRALTAKGYEVNYTWGLNNHGQSQGGVIFPEMMRWLWRDLPVSTDPNDMVERALLEPAAAAAKP